MSWLGQRVESASIQLERIKLCPICSSDDCVTLFKVYDWLYGLPGEFRLSRCNECGVIYLSERPTEDTIASYYPDSSYYSYRPPASYSLFRRRDLVSFVWYFIKKSILAHKYNYKQLGGNKLLSLLAHTPFHGPATFELDVLLHPFVENGSLLEIGCGSGMYLDLMKALGWSRVVGVDIGEEGVRRAKEALGLETYCGKLGDIRFESGTFDAVSLSHTLEHMHDPVGTLREIQRILKPGGRLAIVVPNVESLSSGMLGEYWFGLDSPRHLVHFTPGTLSKALNGAGFAITKLRTIPRFAYKTALFSYSRKAGEDSVAYRTPEHRFPLTRCALAIGVSILERVQCGMRFQVGEEIVAIAVKPHLSEI